MTILKRMMLLKDSEDRRVCAAVSRAPNLTEDFGCVPEAQVELPLPREKPSLLMSSGPDFYIYFFLGERDFNSIWKLPHLY